MAGDNPSALSPAGDNSSRVEVFLRIRPMNKFEASKRAKDCIELQDDPSKITIESPLQGIFDFSFQSVFDEYTTQEEVYRGSSLQEIPQKLLNEGVDCTVLAFGQTSTGKSHLLFGPSATADLLDLESQEGNNEELLPNLQGLTESQGMMARVVMDLFQTIQNDLPSSTECTIKFSMVELYLERWTDLLYPEQDSAVWVDQHSKLHGASELCCLQPQDVFRAMIRGIFRRMQSATEQNQDATRSHVLLLLKVEQIDRVTESVGTTTLRMVDLAGSELGRARSSRQLESPLALEGRMVSASLQSLINYVRAKVSEDGSAGGATPSSSSSRSGGRMHPSKAYATVSKLTKLLQSSVDGPCFTTTFLTISPSSYNIGETLNTLRFGSKLQELRLKAISETTRNIFTSIPLQDYPARFQHAERQIENLTRFVKLLAVECRIVRKTGKIKQPHAVWDVISRIAKSSSESDGDATDLVISVSRTRTHEEKADDDPTILQRLKEAQNAKEKAESQTRDYQSELTALKAESEHLKKENTRLDRELKESKDVLAQISQEKAETDHNLRTSQFREHEAIVFLRQFRSFYLRLLKSKAAHGNGNVDAIVNDMIHEVPGAANLKELLDVDQVMIQSGLIELQEAGEDTNDPDYIPSPSATQNSETEAEKAEQKENDLMEDLKGSRIESADTIRCRQKLVETPAGRLVLRREKELETSIIALSSKCVGLENTVVAEKAMVEALSTRQGALGKMKAAQEMNHIKGEFERRSNDLQAIVWKMNELHLVNKTVNQQVESRETHVAYLEESLTGITNKNRQLLSEKQEDEKKLRTTINQLQNQVKSTTVKLWQLGELQPTHGPFRCKVVAPVPGKSIQLTSPATERRVSLGDITEEGIELLDPPSEKKLVTMETGIQTNEIVVDIDDVAVQTDPVQVFDMDEKPSFPATAESSLTTVQTEDATSSESKSQDTENRQTSELFCDIGIQTEVSEPTTQQDPSPTMEDGTAHITNPKEGVLMVDTGIQTERERTTICFEASTQTDSLPDDIFLHISKSDNSSGSLLGEEEHVEIVKSTKPLSKRAPPNPHWNKEAGRSFPTKLNEDGSTFHNSSNSLGSFSNPQPTHSEKQSLGASLKWNTTSSSSARIPDDRLGASMSVLQGRPSQKTTDWRSKLREKGFEAPQTPTRSRSLALEVNSRVSWTPTSGSKVAGSPSHSSLSRKKVNDPNVPEWMAKFKTMGIKTDPNDVEEQVESALGAPANKQKRHSIAGGGLSNRNIPASASKGHGTDGASKHSTTRESEQQEQAVPQPEWMQRFKEIGMKEEEEEVIESTRGEKVTAEAKNKW